MPPASRGSRASITSWELVFNVAMKSRAARHEFEQMWIASDADHLRIDFEERPALFAPAVAGQRPRTQANDRHAIEAAGGCTCSVDGFGERTARIIIGLRNRRSLDRSA